MKSLLIIAGLASISVGVQAQTIDFSNYDTLTVDQKVEFFGGISKLKLQNEADLLKVLALGASDKNEVVRRRAAQRAATSLIGLQQLAQSGRSATVSAADLQALVHALAANLNATDTETRAAAILTLTASGAPNQVTETMLLTAFEREQNDEVRATLIEAMTSAGYQSDIFKRAIISRIHKSRGKEFEAIASTCSRLRISDALPELISLLGQEGISQVMLLRAIAGYGKAAIAAKAKLEIIAENPALPFQAEARSALAALALESPPAPPQPPFVDLVPVSSVQRPEPAKQDSSSSSTPKTRDPSAPIGETKPTATAPIARPVCSTPVGVAVALIVVAIALLWLTIKKRK